MLDEALLTRAFERPAQEASANAIDAIMHLAQSANYQPAAERAAELIESGCRDVRVFVAYALGVFAQRGPASVPSSFDAIRVALSAPESDALASTPNRRTVDTALRFGFRMLKAQLDFDERQSEPARQAWAQHLAPDSAASMQRACATLRTAILALNDAPRCADELGAVITRLDAYCARNAKEQQPKSRAASEPLTSSEVAPPRAEPPVPASPVPAPPAAPAFARRASDYDGDEGQLAVSPALQHFMRKLEAFERLIAAGSLGKAAIVADDIRNVVAAFDPMVYLPNLLAPHFRLLSENVEELSPYWDQGLTAARQALEQLYRVDLDAFVET